MATGPVTHFTLAAFRLGAEPSQVADSAQSAQPRNEARRSLLTFDICLLTFDLRAPADSFVHRAASVSDQSANRWLISSMSTNDTYDAQPVQALHDRAVRNASAPVGHASAQRRATMLSPSASDLPNGTATATSNPRPIMESPKGSPAAAAIRTQASQLMHLPGS